MLATGKFALAVDVVAFIKLARERERGEKEKEEEFTFAPISLGWAWAASKTISPAGADGGRYRLSVQKFSIELSLMLCIKSVIA